MLDARRLSPTPMWGNLEALFTVTSRSPDRAHDRGLGEDLTLPASCCLLLLILTAPGADGDHHLPAGFVQGGSGIGVVA